jgi:hypothetical protein
MSKLTESETMSTHLSQSAGLTGHAVGFPAIADHSIPAIVHYRAAATLAHAVHPLDDADFAVHCLAADVFAVVDCRVGFPATAGHSIPAIVHYHAVLFPSHDGHLPGVVDFAAHCPAAVVLDTGDRAVGFPTACPAEHVAAVLAADSSGHASPDYRSLVQPLLSMCLLRTSYQPVMSK